MLIDAKRSVLLLIDLQTRLASAVERAEDCLSRCLFLLAASERLGVPHLVTEHCPDRVGPTVPRLRTRLRSQNILQKRSFNAVSEPAFEEAFPSDGRNMVIIGGMEAHVCVLQTALGLKASGYHPVVVADAVASRRPESQDLALRRLRHHGVDIVNGEMVVFEWLEVGDSEAFRALLPMIRSGRADDLAT